MASADTNFTPFMVEGAEPFSRQVQSHYSTIGAASPLVLDFLDKVTPTPGQPFVVGDYGTADGGTSYSLIQEVIAHLRRKYGSNLPIQVLYEDQPINDFKPVFLRVNGLMPGIQGLTSQFSNVYVTATGTSFYSQCVPPNSFDFVVCFNSIQWLSKTPDVRPATLWPTIANGPARQACEKQAEEDWETFLVMRGKELKHGGYLVVTCMVRSSDERLVGFRVEDILSVSARVWQGMLVDGLIDKMQFEKTQIAGHLRSGEELEKPFKDDQSSVSMSGLKLVCVGKDTVTCEFNSETEGKEQAQLYVDELRAWQEGALLQGLQDDGSTDDKKAIIDIFYARYLQFVVRESVKLRVDLVQHVMVIKKDNPSSTR